MNGDEWMNELIKEWMNVWRRLMTHFSYDISVNGLIWEEWLISIRLKDSVDLPRILLN